MKRLAAALVLHLVLATSFARAENGSDATIVALAQWQQQDGHLALVIPLAGALTPKQKSIVTGGFTTVSQVAMRLPKPGQDEPDENERPFYSVRCSVKFDAWEETYDVARLDDSPKTALVKQFSSYADMCLTAELAQSEIIAKMAPGGGTLFAQLVVKQTSLEEASRIKEWLVQQQSGVMQSLFSHMLGELTLNQNLEVRVSVPPKPQMVNDKNSKAPVHPPIVNAKGKK